MLTALLLLLSSHFVLSAAQSDRNSVKQWTELVRQEADRYVSTNVWNPRLLNPLDKYSSRVPTDNNMYWVHKGMICGGQGGMDTLKWMIGYMSQQHQVKSIKPAQASGDEIAAWKVTFGDDGKTRKCSITGQFNNNRLVNYYLGCDHNSPVV